MQTLHLSLLPDRLAVCQFAPDATLPDWFVRCRGFTSAVRTTDELTLVCAAEAVPAGVKQEPGWRLLKVAGPLDFALTGILASITAPLARAGISVFALSTFDTDYVLVKATATDSALAALRAAGHRID